MANTDYKHPNTLWLTIKRKLEIDIINGKYKSAERVPSISELSDIYNIGHSTSKKVLEKMFEEGTITKQRGVGYFVKPFMKEKLKSKHMEELEYGLNKYIYNARQLGLSKETTNTLIDNIVVNVYDN